MPRRKDVIDPVDLSYIAIQQIPHLPVESRIGMKTWITLAFGLAYLGSGCTNAPEIVPGQTLAHPSETSTSMVDPTATMAATETPLPTLTPIPTATATEAPTPTATPTEAPHRPELIEFPGALDEVDLDFGGRVVRMKIGTEADSNILNTWSQWGITGFGINAELPDYQKKLSLLVTGALWQSSTGAQQSYEEFMQHSDRYQMKLVTPGGKEGPITTVFHLNDIKNVEYRFIDQDDPRLYLTALSPRPSGYEFDEHGTLVIYSTTWKKNDQLSAIFSNNDPQLFKGKGFEEFVADFEVGNFLWDMLYITYTPSITSDGIIEMNDGGFLVRLKKVTDVSDYPTSEQMKALGVVTLDQLLPYELSHSFWKLLYN